LFIAPLKKWTDFIPPSSSSFTNYLHLVLLRDRLVSKEGKIAACLGDLSTSLSGLAQFEKDLLREGLGVAGERCDEAGKVRIRGGNPV
jgi:hypothetical protein